MTTVQTGLEHFLASPPEWIRGCRLGLLSNPASVDRRFRHARTLMETKFPGGLKALYSPQHGFFSEKQDNMVESGDIVDPQLEIPVFSLYGRTRVPTREMLDPIDVLIVDLQDAGTRVYTFIYTMSYCLEKAAEYGKRVVVLDRPNPVNGISVEGNCLSEKCASFVGRYPLPMRHGLTIGELALFFNRQYNIGCDLEIIPMKGWQRAMFYPDTGLPWVPPSPNLPTPASALVYPGQVLWEGTNVSEGRGTTLPFELFGAPFVDTRKVLATIGGRSLPGVILRETAFEPTSNKWAGRLCRGFQIHVTDRSDYRPFRTTLRLMQALKINHGSDFKWNPPPYEYEFERLPIDLIIGSSEVRRCVERLESLADLESSWAGDLASFAAASRGFHLYG